MINEKKKLLIEIGTEELPSDELNIFSKILLINLRKLLKKNSIKTNGIKNFITIRRIAFIINIENLNETLIKTIIEKLLKETKFKINMKWNSNKDTFIRPINWYVLMYENKLIEHTIFNTKSNNFSMLHRIKEKKVKITAHNYEKILKKGYIIVDQKKRFKMIKEKLVTIAKKYNIKLMINKTELNKISNSVEYPKIIICKFNKKFLNIPEKIVINNLLEKNCIIIIKKYITNRFIIIADTYINNIKKIKSGYEKCVNMKLSESEYFYKQTTNFIKIYKLNTLKNITFHEKLGSLYNKINRLTNIIKNINIKNKIKIIKAIILSKLDIQTKIISEMPNIKGIISAHNIKINNDLSKILYDYNKTFNNEIPESKIASIITILDNIDNIVGFFLIGEKAKNKKDPYNLRRDALIIIKTIIKNNLKIDLEKIIDISLNSYKTTKQKIKNEIKEFIIDRLKFHNKNNLIENIKINDLNKKQKIMLIYKKFCLYKINNEIKIIVKRINKIKIKNLIKNDHKYNRNLDKNINKTILIKNLFKQIKIIRLLYNNNLIFEYIKTLLILKKHIDIFFNKIFILNENEAIKKNNLKIINILDKYLNSLIDFKKN